MPTFNRNNRENIAVDPRRLSQGTWNHERNRQLDEGDIAASYSADVIAMQGRVRKPFVLRGCLWIITSSGMDRFEAYRLVAEQDFNGTPTTYANKVHADGGKTARDDSLGFYHGMTVQQGGKRYVLTGPPVTFIPGDPEPTQGNLFE